MSAQQFFNPLLETEKNNILDYIQKNNIECVVKIFDSYYRTQFLKTNKNNILISKKNLFKITTEKILVSFDSVGDQFFFESTVTGEESILQVETPDQIFKLQRRNDFRVTIPSHIRPIIKIKKYPELKTEIRDMSLGGCKITLKTEFKLDLNLDQDSEIHIKVLNFEEKNFGVVIKFVDFVADAKTMMLGLQFKELNSDQTSLMRNTLLQIDRMLRNRTQD
jgi:c-di-GMP-binding flagellar brake protein YcgR